MSSALLLSMRASFERSWALRKTTAEAKFISRHAQTLVRLKLLLHLTSDSHQLARMLLSLQLEGSPETE